MLLDSFHRKISYLRLSVTDRCNLRCRYCMPQDGVQKLGHDDILSYEEFLRIVRAAAGMGMTKVRLTGGEPLVRKGILDFIRQLASIDGVMDLRLTTNGVLLPDMAEDLIESGVKRVNISLDSLDEKNFEFITGRNAMKKVWRGVEKAIEIGFDRVKLNCVAIKGVNDHEIPDFAKLSREMPLEVRFIEFMPIKSGKFWNDERFMSAEEVKAGVETIGELKAVPRNLQDGPARVFRFDDAPGTVGFISPVTDHFCATCNRLRLTADGKIRVCLLSNIEIDVKQALRDGAGQEELSEIIKKAVASKPKAHPIKLKEDSTRSMNLIGG